MSDDKRQKSDVEWQMKVEGEGKGKGVVRGGDKVKGDSSGVGRVTGIIGSLF